MAARTKRILLGLLPRLLALCFAVVATFGLFLLLPLLQNLSDGAKNLDLLVQEVGYEPENEELEEDVKEQEEPEPEPEKPPEPPPELAQAEVDLSNVDFAGGGDGQGGAAAGLGLSLDDALASADAGGAEEFLPSSETPPSIKSRVRVKLPRSGSTEGTVIVRVALGPNGEVLAAKIERSTNPNINSAVLEAVKRYGFEPAKRNGKPAASFITVPFEFGRS